MLKRICLTATAETSLQARALLEVGVDRLVIGERRYGLRLPGYFSLEEIADLIAYAHANQKQVVLAANAILHNEEINHGRDFLKQAKQLNPDALMVGDTGLIQIMKEDKYAMPFIYDAGVLVTNPGQVNFWAKHGAIEALLANELPYVELDELAQEAKIPLMHRVYGAMCIHQSGRKLLDNYLNRIGQENIELDHNKIFLSEPKKEETHYSIFQDQQGTHIFANNDLNLIEQLDKLYKAGITSYYLDGVLSPGENFVEIAKVFVQAKQALETDKWSSCLAQELDEKVASLHPENRELGTGFFEYDRQTVR